MQAQQESADLQEGFRRKVAAVLLVLPYRPIVIFTWRLVDPLVQTSRR